MGRHIGAMRSIVALALLAALATRADGRALSPRDRD